MKEKFNDMLQFILARKRQAVIAILFVILLSVSVLDHSATTSKYIKTISTLKLQKEDHSSEVTELENTIRQLKDKISSLEIKHTQNQKQLTAYHQAEQENITLNQQLDAVQDKLEKLNTSNTKLKEKNTTLTKRVSTLKQTVKTLKASQKKSSPKASSKNTTKSSTKKQTPAKKISSNSKNKTSTTDNKTVMVHITKTGEKYHNAGCRYLRYSDYEVSLDEAEGRGLTPCSVCH